MAERTALGAAIEKHWRAHCPKMVTELAKNRKLNKAVLDAQELTGDLLYELVSVRKMNYDAAWELAMREWALLREAGYQKPETGNRKKTRKNRKSSAKSSRRSSRSRKRYRRKTSG